MQFTDRIIMIVMLWAVVGCLTLFVLDSFVFPHIRWYRRFRTWLFRCLPYKGAIVGYQIRQDQFKTGMVWKVNRSSSEVLLITVYRDSEGVVIGAQQDWYRTGDLSWFPWYASEADVVDGIVAGGSGRSGWTGERHAE